MRRAIVALCFAAACNSTTSVRLQLALDDGAPIPDDVEVSIYDRLGGIAYGVEVAAQLPGDLVVLVSGDAEFVRAVARGMTAGLMVVEGVAATSVEPGREMPLPLLLS